jgi:TolB-like protein
MAEPDGRRRITQRWTTPLAAILLVAAAWFAWDRLAAPVRETEPTEAPAATPDATPAAGEIYYGPANSLAVLPFVDRSPTLDQAPQALGFAGDLLERFVDVEGLQSIARRSAFYVRDGATPLRVIAERLQCAFLLRGEWRNDNGQLALAASLYDARRDREIWRASRRQPGQSPGLSMGSWTTRWLPCRGQVRRNWAGRNWRGRRHPPPRPG